MRLTANRRGMVRVPRALAALLAVVALVATSWAVLLPAWQVTDEDVHFSYVQTLAEEQDLPGRTGRPFSTEMFEAMRALNSKAANFQLEAKPAITELEYDDWRRTASKADRDDGGGATSASGYPPAYYLSVTPAYVAASGGDLFTRITAVRLASALWLLVGTVGAWLLAGAVLGRRRPLQLACAATVGLWPMATYVGAGTNPDSMQNAMWTLAFWLGASILRHGLTGRRAVGLGLVVGLALAGKATSVALLPAAVFVIGLGAWRLLRQGSASRAVGLAALAAAAVAVPAGSWVVTAGALDRPPYGQVSALAAEGGTTKPFLVREFASYVWQFYFPPLPFQKRLRLINPVISDYPLHNIWFGHMSGVFGWTNVWFPPWVYNVILVALMLVLVGAAVAAFRALRRAESVRSAVGSALPLVVFFGLATVAVLGGLHLTEYRQFITGGGPFMQGRYLLPLLGIGGLVVASAIGAVGARVRGAVVGAWLAGLLVYQLAALALNLTRFYA